VRLVGEPDLKRDFRKCEVPREEIFLRLLNRAFTSHLCGGMPVVSLNSRQKCDFDKPTPSASVAKSISSDSRSRMKSVVRRTCQGASPPRDLVLAASTRPQPASAEKRAMLMLSQNNRSVS
jgi:hypothetical protein